MNDDEILDMIFGNNSRAACNKPAVELVLNDCSLYDTETQKKASALELIAIQCAEAGNHEEALQNIKEAEIITPQNPSIYNN
jgi:hypothetical protein